MLDSSPNVGILYESQNGVMVQLDDNCTTVASLNASTYETGLTVWYQGNEGFFTTPRVTWNGDALLFNASSLVISDTASGELEPATQSFSYSFTTSSTSGLPTVVSLAVVQEISIVNVNDPTTISFTYESRWLSQGSISVYPLGYVSDGSRDVTSIATINGFQLIDPDLGVDPIKVEISTIGGKLYLNEEFLQEVDFSTLKMCYGSAWQVNTQSDW